MRKALLLAVLAPLALAQSSCQLLSQIILKPEVSLIRVDLTNVSFEGLGVNFVLGVRNPNPLGVNLARLDYQLTVDGHQFAAGVANNAVSVPAQGTGQVNLPVSFKFVELFRSIQALFTKKDLPYGIATNLGFASPIGVLNVPLATQGVFPVPRLPNVAFSGVKMGAVDLTGATINIGLDIGNPNTFALPVNNLNYKVSIAGAPVVESSTGSRSLAPGASSAVPISVRVDFLKSGLALANAIRSGTATVALDGAVDLGVYKHPINLQARIAR